MGGADARRKAPWIGVVLLLVGAACGSAAEPAASASGPATAATAAADSTRAATPVSASGGDKTLAGGDGAAEGASSIERVRAAAVPITGGEHDFDALLEAVGDAQFVLLGEATHGTHEFYRARAEITRRLIREEGFSAVAVEAPWPHAYRVNEYVRGRGQDATAAEALSTFREFPEWMWRNRDVVELVEWLRGHNTRLPPRVARAGFYGLDLYSLPQSIDAVIEHLEDEEPEAAERARDRYACFADVRSDPQMYAFGGGSEGEGACRDEALEQYRELAQRRSRGLDEEAAFDALQNARVVLNAERFYRGGGWNSRDRHMFDALLALTSHLSDAEKTAKVVVWAHNSHVGDARATEMGERGELNIGQLVRGRNGERAILVGFTTYEGSVVAASAWGQRGQVQDVRPALAESYEALFHEVADGGSRDFLVALRDTQVAQTLAGERLERAIGVVYAPQSERQSHYFTARLSHQFDAVIHYDRTTALDPLPPAGEE